MKKGLIEDRLGFAGLLAISIIAVFELMSVDDLSIAQWVALYCFAACIPALGGSLWILVSVEYYKKRPSRWYIDAQAAVGIIGASVGVSSLFVHISWVLAAVFAAAGVCAFVTWGLYGDALAAEDKDKSTTDDA